MERNAPESGPESKRLSEPEMAGVYSLIVGLLVRKGTCLTAPGVYTPEGRPDALQFYISLDSTTITEIFFPTDEAIEILSEDTYLSYVTPHSLDAEATEIPESSICLNIRGRFPDTTIDFGVGYIIRCSDETLPEDEEVDLVFNGDVQIEYFQNNRIVEDGAFEIGEEVFVLSSRNLYLTQEDGNRLRRLVDILS